MIIDFHTHCYPPNLAAKLVRTVQPPRWIPTPTKEVLLSQMEEVGIDLCVNHPVANRPDTVRDTNRFAQSVQNDRIISFAAIHPDSPDVLDWLDEVREMGAKGVKFHPPFQRFLPHDPKYRPVYRKIGELGLISLFHGGRARPKNQETFCTPATFATVVDAFQGAPVILAHMGGFRIDDEELNLLPSLPVYVDTALWPAFMSHLSPERMTDLIRQIGAERVIFGSDFPYTPADDSIQRLCSLPLSEGEKELIFSGNAKRLLGLTKEPIA